MKIDSIGEKTVVITIDDDIGAKYTFIAGGNNLDSVMKLAAEALNAPNPAEDYIRLGEYITVFRECDSEKIKDEYALDFILTIGEDIVIEGLLVQFGHLEG